MKTLGICTGIGYPVPLEERLSLIKSAGFDFVCLDFEKEIEHTEGTWEQQLALAEKAGLPVEAVHLTGAGMTSIFRDCDEAELVTRRLIDELMRLGTLGVPVGVAHITWGFDVPAPVTESALLRFDRIADAAEKAGVKLALENSVFGECVHAVLDRIDSKNVGFCYDSGHDHAFTPGENYLECYGNRLFTMHLHDNNGKEDQHDVPFRGKIDWEKTAALLNKTELFKKSVILEIGVQKEPLPALLALACRAAKKLASL